MKHDDVIVIGSGAGGGTGDHLLERLGAAAHVEALA
jgi:hypothetical protein